MKSISTPFLNGENRKNEGILNKSGKIVDVRIHPHCSVSMFPGGFFQTIVYPLNFSMVNAITPYQSGISLSVEQTFPILDIVLPHGTYTCYGIVMTPGSDPWDDTGWIYFDFKTFEMK